jgi:predicted ATP-grasp superfamily ATP-dependent carboligase
METVLVLDGLQRSALAVVRSLGSKGVRVITSDTSRLTLSGSSRFSFASEVYADPSNSEAFIADVNRIIQKYDITVLYPTTEVTVYTLLEHQEKLLPVKLPFNDIDTVRSVSDKAALIERCQQLLVQAPASEYYANFQALAASSTQFDFPVVLKPTLSRIKVDGGWLATAVTYAHSQQELESIASTSVAFRDHPFMLQEYINGHGAGVFLLYDHGKCIAYFAHKRLREKPPTGGVSVLSESIRADEKQLNAAKKILDSVAWHGVAMVEFKVNDAGEPYIIEVNPRFWGSLQLSIDSGVDFPYLLHEATMGRACPSVTSYKEGQKLRWLLGDFDRLYLVLKGHQYTWIEKLKEVLRFMLPFAPGRRYEVNRFGDFRPFLSEIKTYIKSLGK